MTLFPAFLSSRARILTVLPLGRTAIALFLWLAGTTSMRAAYSNLTLLQEIYAWGTPGSNYESGGTVTTQSIFGKSHRVATGDQSWFGYKIGSNLQFDKPYVIEVVYPEDVPRSYLMLLMDCGGWQPGTHFAFHTGIYEGEDSRFFWPENKTAYPLRQGHKSYWIIAWPQKHWKSQGQYNEFRNTHGNWNTGLWLYFINKKDDTNNNGLAVRSIRLYSVNNLNDLLDPQVEQLRLASPRKTYWTLESESRNTCDTLAAKARIAGVNTLVPVMMSWNFSNGEYAYYPGHFKALFDRMIPAARQNQMAVIPKLEYGGSPSLPADAWAVTPNNVGYEQEMNRVGGHGTGFVKRVNVRSAAVREDLYLLIDSLFEAASSGSQQIKGIMLRNRYGFFAPSFSNDDLVAYESETGRTIAGATSNEKRATLKSELPWLATWAANGEAVNINEGHRHPYMQWYYGHLSNFLADVENYLKTNYGKDKVLLYHHFSAEGIFRQMTTDQSRFFSRQEWGFEPGMFNAKTFFSSAPVDQYWNAGAAAHLNAFSSSEKTSVLVDPMYIEYGWNWFPYSQIAPSFEHGGQEYSIRSELLAVANSNPMILGKSDFSSIHRGFPTQWNAFAKNFYLIPDEVGSTLLSNADVTVKTYTEGRVLVINKSLVAQTINLSGSYSTLYNKVSGTQVNASNISVGACSMLMLGTQPGGLPSSQPPLQSDPEPQRYIYEAEEAAFSGGSIVTEIYPYCSGDGVYDYPGGAGGWLEFRPNISEEGLYRLKIIYALGTGSRPLQLTVDGLPVSVTSFPATGNSRIYDAMVFENIALIAGENTIRLTATNNDGPNIDYLEIIKARTGDLFTADFETGAATRWSSGLTDPWSINTDGGSKVYQSALAWHCTEFNLAGETFWKNYELKLNVKITEMTSWSYTYLFARYTNASNYYQVTLEKTESTTRIRLSKRKGGVTTVLGTANVDIAISQWHNINLRMIGNRLVVGFNQNTLIDVQDGSPLTHGRIGIATQKQAISFDNVTVTQL